MSLPQSRRDFLKQAAGVSVALTLTGCGKTLNTAAQAKKPNIVFILVDDLGYADLACYGNTLHETPNIDRLAAAGVRFTQAYTPCAVCSPTRAAIQTGKYPIRMGITDWIPGDRRKKAALKEKYTEKHMPLEEVTLAETLKEAGYRTSFLGKWHLGETAEYWPEYQGYDVNLGGHSKGQPPAGYFAPYKNPRLQDGPDGEYLTDRLGDEAVKLIEHYAQSPDAPFMMMMAFYTVHMPIQPRSELKEKYQKKLETAADRRWTNPGYAAMVQSLDENVGKILNSLKQQGIEKDTIVIFTSDNGGVNYRGVSNNDPLRSGKGHYYEGGVRVPTIIHWPQSKITPAAQDCPIISMDFYPTILEMAGLPQIPQQHKDGLSLTSVLKGGPAPSRDTLYWHYPHYHGSGETPCSAIRCGDFKFIRHYEDGKRELYNLKADIGETTDLMEQSPDKALELEAKLDVWLREMNACIPHLK